MIEYVTKKLRLGSFSSVSFIFFLMFSYTSKAQSLNNRLLERFSWYSTVGVVEPHDTIVFYSRKETCENLNPKSICAIYKWFFANGKLSRIDNLAGCGEPPEGGEQLYFYDSKTDYKIEKLFGNLYLFLIYNNRLFSYRVQNTSFDKNDNYIITLIKECQRDIYN